MLMKIITPTRSLKVERTGASKLSGSRLCFFVKNAVAVAIAIEAVIETSAEAITAAKKGIKAGWGRFMNEETK